MAHYMNRPQVVNRSGNHGDEIVRIQSLVGAAKNQCIQRNCYYLVHLLEINRIYLFPIRNKSIPLDYQLIINIARMASWGEIRSWQRPGRYMEKMATQKFRLLPNPRLKMVISIWLQQKTRS